MQQGVNSQTQLFVESLSFDGRPQNTPMRGLVQARQIYSFAEGARLKVLDEKIAKDIVHKAAKAYIKYYRQPNNAFVHSIQPEGKSQNLDLDLYSQAFAIFGLAHAYELTKDEDFKKQAEKTLSYLRQERKNPHGGFTEIKSNEKLYQSNPHMHLFEAVLAWIKLDENPIWIKTAQEIKNLCLEKFIDPKTKILGERFDERWTPIRNEKQNFVFEPGHQYEWAWLFNWYGEIFKEDLQVISKQLFQNGEKYGLSPDKTLAYDEIWSNGEVKKASSRFWPQSERIKAAVVLKEKNVADVATKSLMDNFLLMDTGLWRDTLIEKGQYGDQPAKASSLYHIINAISEYLK